MKKSVEGNFSFVEEEQLSSAVNKIESRIASKSTSISTISLVIHMTEESHNPLYIVNKKDHISKSNSFFVPRWGALILHNDRLILYLILQFLYIKILPKSTAIYCVLL